MRKHASLLAALSGVACIAILVAMLVLHAWPLWTGQVVFIKLARPIDPRDPFRGDYVILDYHISRLRLTTDQPESLQTPSTDDQVDRFRWRPDPIDVKPLGQWAQIAADQDDSYSYYRDDLRDRKVYVQLHPQPSEFPEIDQEYVAVSVCDHPVPDMVNLRGIVRQATRSNWEDRDDDRLELTIHYGIDALYVQQGSGYPIEEKIRTGAPGYAVVAIARSGQARLKHLIFPRATD